MVFDKVPFQDLRAILRGANDDRIQVYAEWVRPDYYAMDKQSWATGYLTALHEVVDGAIRSEQLGTEAIASSASLRLSTSHAV